MKIYKEERLKDFTFWAGAKYRAEKLTEAEFEIIESVLEDVYPDGLSETTVNDMFWFDEDFIAECLLGLSTCQSALSHELLIKPLSIKNCLVSTFIVFLLLIVLSSLPILTYH